MQYRSEIDGLRAIAVLPVILFHAGFTSFSGGFVGVDVFFVISGYLITSILLEEIGNGSFSISRFYERRARRILPALFTVILACLPFAYLWMLPSQLKDFSASAVTTVLAVSNFYFLSQIDYFAPASELQPLLHTWSLAIEEQYYFLFPFVLLALRNRSWKTQVFSLAVLTLFSFGFSEWGWRADAARSFFFTLSRFWEIGVGSLCAFLVSGRKLHSSNLLAGTGLALILLAVFAYDASVPFPSYYTIVPVGGAALVILFAGEATLTARLLSWRVLVGIGLVSYSAYLWHQPLFAFARLRSFGEPTASVMAALAVGSLLLGWVTWRFVEQPFRRGPAPLLAGRRKVFGASAAGIASIGTLGLVVYLDEGLEWRMDKTVERYAAANIPRAQDGPCFLTLADPIAYPLDACRFADNGGSVDVLLAGDSHVLALSEEVGAELRRHNIGYYHATYNSCLAIPGFSQHGDIATADCLNFVSNLYDYVETEGIRTLILGGRFPAYLDGTRFDNREGGIEAGERPWYDLVQHPESIADDEARRGRVLAGFEAEIRGLAKSFDIVLVYPIPEAGWDVPATAFKSAFLMGLDSPLTTSYAVYKERTQEVNELFDRLAAELPNVHPARVYEAFCSEDTGRCTNADVNGVYYFDDDHLSNAGAKLVAPMIAGAVRSVQARSQ